MIRFIFRRILETIPVLWAVATITFFMLRLAPGGPFDDERQVSPEVLRTLQAHYGLDKPLIAQYGDYLLNLLKGDLGPSFKYPGRTVNEIIRDSFPNSMELGFYSMSIALALGLTLGILASLKPNSILDYLPFQKYLVSKFSLMPLELCRNVYFLEKVSISVQINKKIEHQVYFFLFPAILHIQCAHFLISHALTLK